MFVTKHDMTRLCNHKCWPRTFVEKWEYKGFPSVCDETYEIDGANIIHIYKICGKVGIQRIYTCFVKKRDEPLRTLHF